MKPLTKLTLKNAFFSGLLFAILMSIPIFGVDKPFSIYKFLFHAFFFGVCIAFMGHYRQVFNLESIGITNPTEKNLKLRQSKTIETDKTLEEIKDILVTHKYITRKSIRSTVGGFKANTTWSFSSCGERLEIKKSKVSNSYTINSSPKITLGLDYSKNLINVTKIEKLLRS